MPNFDGFDLEPLKTYMITKDASKIKQSDYLNHYKCVFSYFNILANLLFSATSYFNFELNSSCDYLTKFDTIYSGFFY
jgi:hypothetical protein